MGPHPWSIYTANWLLWHCTLEVVEGVIACAKQRSGLFARNGRAVVTPTCQPTGALTRRDGLRGGAARKYARGRYAACCVSSRQNLAFSGHRETRCRCLLFDPFVPSHVSNFCNAHHPIANRMYAAIGLLRSPRPRCPLSGKAEFKPVTCKDLREIATLPWIRFARRVPLPPKTTNSDPRPSSGVQNPHRQARITIIDSERNSLSC